MKDNFMKFKDLKDKNIHFIGIGGIGMSALAQLLVEKGCRVSGSDVTENASVDRLKKQGVSVTIGHKPETLQGKDVVVLTTDIKKENLELKEAHSRAIPLLHRAEMLAILMEDYRGIAIAGTHGKTTITGLTGWILEGAGLDPTIVNGGIMNSWGTNAKIGSGEWCVVEADESDGSFLKLPKNIALISNIDPEHMDHYGSVQTLHNAFENFAVQIPSTGVAILGIDHPQVYALWKKIKDKQRCLSYGFHEKADIRAEGICIKPEGTNFNLIYKDECSEVTLSLYGTHNVLNALGAACVAFECGVDLSIIRKALSTFKGVQRRFTYVGEWEGVTIIDDYAHHPTEIRATLTAAKSATNGRIIAVLQPHRYSRLADQFQDFSQCCGEADMTIVLPVFAAREQPKKGITHEALAKAMSGEVYCCATVDDLPHHVLNLAQSGDMVVCLGAGSISSLAHTLPLQLKQSYKQIV